MKEEIWNKLYLYLIRIEIGVFKNFKECARSPCNGNHFSSLASILVVTRTGIKIIVTRKVFGEYTDTLGTILLKIVTCNSTYVYGSIRNN